MAVKPIKKSRYDVSLEYLENFNGKYQIFSYFSEMKLLDFHGKCVSRSSKLALQLVLLLILTSPVLNIINIYIPSLSIIASVLIFVYQIIINASIILLVFDRFFTFNVVNMKFSSLLFIWNSSKRRFKLTDTIFNNKKMNDERFLEFLREIPSHKWDIILPTNWKVNSHYVRYTKTYNYATNTWDDSRNIYFQRHAEIIFKDEADAVTFKMEFL